MASTLTVDNIVGATSSDTVHLPGHVVQLVNSSITGSSGSANSSSWLDTGNTLTITPKYSDSKILVIVHHVVSVQTDNGHTRIDFRCIENGSSTEIYRMDFHGQDGTTNNTQRNMSGSGVFQCTNTNALTFKTQVQKASTTEGTWYPLWYSDSIHTMQALEVAQ